MEVQLGDNFPLPLPGIVSCVKSNPALKDYILDEYIGNAIKRTQSKFHDAPEAASTTLSLLAAIYMNKTLLNKDENHLIQSSFGYFTSDNTFKYLFSNTGELVMSYLNPVFTAHFNIIADYDKGAALEYYFFMKVMHEGIKMTYFGKGFSVTGNTPYHTTIDIQGTKFLMQDSLVDAIKIDNNSTTVIKFIQGHDAIDFIVISKVLNNASQRMFLVQVTNQP